MGVSPVTTTEADTSRDKAQLFDLTSEIVSSYVANHEIAKEEIRDLIHSTFSALNDLQEGVATRGIRPKPSVPIEGSVFNDHIICLEDGKQLKMLKRHLKSAYNMTPEEYRERWGLPADYPMVAPNYAKKRSDLALKIGLGTRSRKQDAA
ncbi:MucR family transcriptional regulator [Alphaproteobacteria bacterium]|nr:MucR family transcriptional regulator [Alphaproteobacteria bacterium]